MKVKDIVDILKCQVLNEGDMEEEVKTACGSDMMSDVLAFVKDQSVPVSYTHLQHLLLLPVQNQLGPLGAHLGVQRLHVPLLVGVLLHVKEHLPVKEVVPVVEGADVNPCLLYTSYLASR